MILRSYCTLKSPHVWCLGVLQYCWLCCSRFADSGIYADKFRARSASEWDVQRLCTVLELVYSTTPDNDRGLRDIVSEICATSISQLLGDYLLSSQRFETTLRNDGSLAFDLLVRVHSAKKLVDREKFLLQQTVHDGERALRRANETIQGLKEEVKSANAREGLLQWMREEEARAAEAWRALQEVRAERSTVRRDGQAGTGARVWEDPLVGPRITSPPLDLGSEGNSNDTKGNGARPFSKRDSSQLAWMTGAILVAAILFKVVTWIFIPPVETSVGIEERNAA